MYSIRGCCEFVSGWGDWCRLCFIGFGSASPWQTGSGLEKSTLPAVVRQPRRLAAWRGGAHPAMPVPSICRGSWLSAAAQAIRRESVEWRTLQAASARIPPSWTEPSTRDWWMALWKSATVASYSSAAARVRLVTITIQPYRVGGPWTRDRGFWTLSPACVLYIPCTAQLRLVAHVQMY